VEINSVKAASVREEDKTDFLKQCINWWDRLSCSTWRNSKKKSYFLFWDHSWKYIFFVFIFTFLFL